MKRLNYMGAADALEVQQTVSRRLLDMVNGPSMAEDEQKQREFQHLESVLPACETVIGFLNDEHAAFHAAKHAQKPDRSDREVFNTP